MKWKICKHLFSVKSSHFFWHDSSIFVKKEKEQYLKKRYILVSHLFNHFSVLGKIKIGGNPWTSGNSNKQSKAISSNQNYPFAAKLWTTTIIWWGKKNQKVLWIKIILMRSFHQKKIRHKSFNTFYKMVAFGLYNRKNEPFNISAYNQFHLWSSKVLQSCWIIVR